MIMPVHFPDRVIECAAHNQPHHQFYSLRTRIPHVVDVRNIGEFFRIVHEVVQKFPVEFLVNQTSTRPLQLMTHAAGSPDLNAEILVK